MALWRPCGHGCDHPARYLNISDFKELSEHAMEDIDTTFAPNVKPGDIIVAGRNFGCGSSREHAPIVIQQKGVACIIAESFARIFYRNAINIGLPVLEIGEEAKKIQAGDQVEVDFDKGEIHVVNKGLVIKTHPLPAFVRKIAEAGGLINYVKGVHA
mgnify:FL=1